MKTKVVVGVDLGGTNTKVGLVDRYGEVLAFRRFKTDSHLSFADFLQRLKGHIDEMVETTTEETDLVSVGVGAPNVNHFTGEIVDPANLEWPSGVKLTELAEAEIGLPVRATNDANVAALGEMEFGAAKGMKNFVVLTLGTGLGSGVVVNGKLLLGEDGLAAEIGHVNVRPDGRHCNCGLHGCLETYVSATGIKRTVYKLLADRQVDSSLRDLSFNELTGEMITEAALAGDPVAAEAFIYTGKILGTKLADIVAYFNPEAIILSGGLTRAGKLLLQPSRKMMEKRLFKAFRDKVKLEISPVTGSNDAVLGAAALAWQEYESL